VSKSIWRMPWHWEAMKDVAGCDKPRGGANTLWSVDFRMGQPTSFWSILHWIHRCKKQTWWTETSQ